MRCQQCGFQNREDATRCAQCGKDLGSAPMSDAKPETSTKAILALVFAILGLTCFSLLTAVPAVILGALALSDCKSRPGVKGKGMALTGIILGSLNIIGSIIFAAVVLTHLIPNLEEAQTRAKAAEVKGQLRMHATALECYCVDHNEYPPKLELLTTPVSYLSILSDDPYKQEKAPFDYLCDNTGWVLRSVGPDGSREADLAEVIESLGDDTTYQGWLYDPTNGIDSNGDLLRTGPYIAK